MDSMVDLFFMFATFPVRSLKTKRFDLVSYFYSTQFCKVDCTWYFAVVHETDCYHDCTAVQDYSCYRDYTMIVIIPRLRVSFIKS